MHLFYIQDDILKSGPLGFNALSLNNDSPWMGNLTPPAVPLYGLGPPCGLPRCSLINPVHIYNNVYCSHEDLGCDEYDD